MNKLKSILTQIRITISGRVQRLVMFFTHVYSENEIIELKEDLKFHENCLRRALDDDEPARTVGYFAVKAQKIRRKLNMTVAWYET